MRNQYRFVSTIYRMIFALAILAVCSPFSARSETLREVLNKEGLHPDTAQIANLDQPIAMNSYAMLNNEQIACIGYFGELDLSQSKYPLPFYLTLLKKADNQWQTNVIGDYQWGTPMDFFATSEFLYLTTHVNPSAGYVGVIRKADLTVYDTLDAALIRILSDNAVLYAGNTIHFAPVHDESVWLYTPETKDRRRIYPFKPYQPVRVQHIARLKAEFERRGDAWFAENNHPKNPELFTESIDWENLAVNEQTDALAFATSYDNTEAWNPDAATPADESSTTDVVCVFWHVRSPEIMRYQEILLTDVKRRYGDMPLAELLTGKRLDEIFQEE